VLGEGTKTHTKEQINEEVQAIGGQSNAYTSNDVTAYHITTASTYFERALNSLADSVQNSTFPEAEVKTQQGIIHNEMNLGEDNPDSVLWKLFYETAFRVHPARFPVIGYRQSFDRLTREDIINYYNSHYTPENSVLSIAGDVSADRAFDAAIKAFGDWERRSASAPAIPDEPRQVSPRRAVLDKENVQLTNMMMGWHTIPLQHPDLYALDVLAQILGGSESSRLVRALRERQSLVSEIGAFSHTPDYNAGVFGIRATFSPNNVSKVENAIWQQIEYLKHHGVTPAELQRAQKQMETSYIFGQDDVAGQAERIATDYLGTGDPTFSSRYVARVKAVTAAQVQEMANKYLIRDATTTAIVRPGSGAPRAASTTTREAVVTRPAQMIKLANGLRLILRVNRATPTVAITVSGMGGTRLEPREKAGLANLTAQMLTRGTKKRSGEAMTQVVDQMGGSLDAFSGYNSWGLTSQWLSRDWRRGLALVHEATLQPTFPADELARLKTQVAAAIRERDDNPETTATLLLRRMFFRNHPYSRSTLGELNTVQKITAGDLKTYWSRVLRPNWTVITIYGDIDPVEVRRNVEFLFGKFTNNELLPTAPSPPAPLPKYDYRERNRPGLAQTVLFYGFPGIRIQDEDRYAVDVMDAALSGIYYPGGRLHARLRDNQLVYGVHAFNQPGIDSGMFVIYAATTRENSERVQSIIDEEVKRIRENNISDEELARAKGMAVTAQAVERQTNLAQAQQAAADELFGLSYRAADFYESRINAITVDDVRRVAEKYLRHDSSALAIVGPPAGAAPAATPAATPAPAPGS
jgi:zinc protease